MEQFMRVFGIKTCIMAEERSITPMVTCSKDNSKMILLMALVSTNTQMAVNMSATGNKTSSMVLVKKSGTMAVNTKDFTKMEPKMVRVNITGPMVTYILANGKTIS